MLLKYFLLLLPVMFMLVACDGGGERQDLKSPCAGLEDSPCGPKRRVNDWWLA